MTPKEIKAAILKALETEPKSLETLAEEIAAPEERIRVQLGYLQANPRQIKFADGKYEKV